MNDDERLDESTDKPDAALDDALFRAFDRMAPSAEVEERMLEVIVSAREAPEDEDESEHEHEYVDGEPPFRPGRLRRVRQSIRPRNGGARQKRSEHRIVPQGKARLERVGSCGGLPGACRGNRRNRPGRKRHGSARHAGRRAERGRRNEHVEREAARSADAVPTPETGAGPAANAAPHLNVVLSDGLQLRIASGEDGLPLAADPALVGDQIEVASAWTDSQERVGCTVFAYDDGVHPYAVRYDGDESFYVASAV